MSPRFINNRSIVPAVYREQIKGSYSWGTFLANLLKSHIRGVRSRCPDSVVSVESFHKAPLVEYMRCIDANMKVFLISDHLTNLNYRINENL